MRSVCVFCGSASGEDRRYREVATSLGAEIARREMRLVFGGSCLGLMGALADAALTGGARVTGVLPEHLLDVELAHPGVEDLRIVSSMHERKSIMAGEADAFVVLPGGLGTLEVALEVLTWSQQGLHSKPVGFVDTLGFYDRFLSFLGHGVTEGFIRAPHLGLYLRDTDPGALLDAMTAWVPTTTPEWNTRT